MAQRFELEFVLSDTAASLWLKDALRFALDRDPTQRVQTSEPHDSGYAPSVNLVGLLPYL